MTEWKTNNCRKTKKILGIDYKCCNSCHEEVALNIRDGISRNHQIYISRKKETKIKK